MGRKNHLFLRDGVYYYRRRVPDRIAARIGQRMIQFSLRTSDKALAYKRREIEDVKCSGLFAKATADLDSELFASDDPSTPKLNALSPNQAVRLAWNYFMRMDAKSADSFKNDGPISDSEREELKLNAEFEIQSIDSLDDPNASQAASWAAQKLLAEEKIPASNSDDIDAEFIALIKRAAREIARRRLARLDSGFSPTFDTLFDPNNPPCPTVAELAKELLQEKREDAKINGATKKAFSKHEASLALVVEILGKDRTASTIGYDECKLVRSKLARVPTNRAKLFRGLSLDQSIERAEAEGHSLLSPITQQTYLAALRDLLDLACKKGIIKSNHAATMKPLKRDPVAAGDKRTPFSLEQLAAFFKSDFYKICASGGPRPYTVADKDWRFWLPLICLFMGLRPNEACQLRRGDVRRTSRGTPYLDIIASSGDGANAAEYKKTLKTETSRRRVPVHPELIKLGFMDFVAENKSSEGLLFSVKPDRDGNHARYPLKRFNEAYLREAIELTPKQVFYSFRHSFADALRRSSAPPHIMRAFGGWSDGAKVFDGYGDQYDPDNTVAHMAEISFPGLDLSHLAVKG
jgi:integrase